MIEQGTYTTNILCVADQIDKLFMYGSEADTMKVTRNGINYTFSIQEWNTILDLAKRGLSMEDLPSIHGKS